VGRVGEEARGFGPSNVGASVWTYGRVREPPFLYSSNGLVYVWTAIARVNVLLTTCALAFGHFRDARFAPRPRAGLKIFRFRKVI
jgi:hypothetical protein